MPRTSATNAPAASLSGVLRRAEDAKSLDVLQMLGRAAPDDVSLMFHVGGDDRPGGQNYFVLTKSEFEDVWWEEAGLGGPFLSIQSGGLALTISDREATERAIRAIPGD